MHISWHSYTTLQQVGNQFLIFFNTFDKLQKQDYLNYKVTRCELIHMHFEGGEFICEVFQRKFYTYLGL